MLRKPLENYELGAASLTKEQRAPASGSVGDHPTDKDMWSRSGVISPPSLHTGSLYRCTRKLPCVSVHLRREFVDSRA